MCVSSFQSGRRLWDSARQLHSKTQYCVTHVITFTSLIQLCITRIYLIFLIVLRPSSDFNRIFMCAGVGTDLISLSIYFRRCLKRNFETTFKISLVLLALYVFRHLFIQNISIPVVFSSRTYPSCSFIYKFNLGSSDPAFNRLILLPNYEIKKTRCSENFTYSVHRFIVNHKMVI